MLVRRVIDSDECARALALRQRVFCGEQGVAPGAEFDGRDEIAVHVVAVDYCSVVGTCRLLVESGTIRLGRMAVARNARRRGIGAALLREAERIARAGDARLMTLHAQVDAEGLYRAGGFIPIGHRFVEQGIEHIAMEKHLA